ncbi:MAG: type III-B CRISPR-associated protein Cas10/Cmr2 [Myxococcota bacterium]|nr:type III-B CRISPR-associated protein Cas10/Cmr2 [Myxococcota bacterium]
MSDGDFWRGITLAFLHDPPDKALDIVRHVSRAAKCASALLGTEVSTQDIEAQRTADSKAASEDRLPVPDAYRGGRYDESRTVNFASREPDDRPGLIRHPMSGEMRRLEIPEFHRNGLDQLEPFRKFAGAVAELEPKLRFFALWRFYPAVVGACHPDLRLLPADTRIPDHTIWNHLDLAAAFGATQHDTGGAALLSFTLGPVQTFIAQAKSLRDLWSGSYLLSWLTFAALEPVIDEFGPTAVVFPSLRGNPICGHRLRRRFGDVFERLGKDFDPPTDPVLGSLPNTFIALVPARQADELRGKVEKACREEWKRICEAVRCRLAKEWSPESGWDRGWEQQTERFWDIGTVAWPLDAGGDGSAETLNRVFRDWLDKDWPPPDPAILDAVVKRTTEPGRPVYQSRPSWALHVEMVGRLMEAAKLIRQVPPHAPVDDERFKCTLTGSLEQMGPAEPEKARQFWENAVARSVEGTHVRKGERLGAVGLVKRFCWPAYFAEELGIRPSGLRFWDTATVAARPWLVRHGVEPEAAGGTRWSGHWVFQVIGRMPPDDDEPIPPDVESGLKRSVEADRRAKSDLPRPYYAALALDGDDMGKWLRGEKAKHLRDAYHPKMVGLFEEGAGDGIAKVQEALDSRRPVTPAQHAALTAALGDFSLGLVPGIVAEALGELVYAGGDDVLALLPIESAVSCADALQRAFKGENDDGLPIGWRRKPERDGAARPAEERAILTLMGRTASASAGIAIAHFKDDLREVLAAARDAEKAAKNSGRDALGIAVLKRSGEHRTVVMKWSWFPTFQAFVKAFQDGASDRWVHALHDELGALEPPAEGAGEVRPEALPFEAIEAEMRRVVHRADKSTRATLETCLPDVAHAKPDRNAAADRVVEAWRVLRGGTDQTAGGGRGEGPLSRFLGLLSAASFIARGGEE